jgi:CheY-like chemotaxis protein
MTAPAILIVEDDPDLREIIAEILSVARFHVVQAAHGAEALDFLQRTERLPGLILLDLMMPVMDGIRFRALQSSDPRLASIPVVVMSAVTDGKQKSAALKPAAFLAKPVEREEIVAVARHHCSPQQSQE